MSHGRRGRAVLINNENFKDYTDMPKRQNTATDVNGLSRVLQDLGFRVQVVEDVTCEQIKCLMHQRKFKFFPLQILNAFLTY